MADHFVSINRGKDGFKDTDFTFGTSSAATDKIELRVLDGAGLTRKDVLLALEAFERLFNNGPRVGAAGFDVAL